MFKKILLIGLFFGLGSSPTLTLAPSTLAGIARVAGIACVTGGAVVAPEREKAALAATVAGYAILARSSHGSPFGGIAVAAGIETVVFVVRSVLNFNQSIDEKDPELQKEKREKSEFLWESSGCSALIGIAFAFFDSYV
jgi:C4-dicarboxylate transporter